MKLLLCSLCAAALMVGGASAQSAPAPTDNAQVAGQVPPAPGKDRPPLPGKHQNPGEHGPDGEAGGPGPHEGGPMPEHMGGPMPGPMGGKAAFFHVQAGPAVVDVKCPEDQSFKDCADVVKDLVDKAFTPPPAPPESDDAN